MSGFSRRAAWALVGALGLSASGCMSLDDARQAIQRQMAPVNAALAAPATAPTCRAGEHADYLAISELTLLEMARGTDEYVAAGASGVAPLCGGTAVDSPEVLGYANRFNAKNIRVQSARKLAKAAGFAVVVTDSVSPPGPRGEGRAQGSVVFVSAAGKLECRAPWFAVNSERTSVSVARLGKETMPATEAAKVSAWESDLRTVTCAA
ncbi:MAG: hypothetical protein IPQ09_16960, partial [Myxococcales bacterium]|nr:hypothetical protein [Myxococcales bacterium]